MEEHELIELRSDEVQEILGTPPSWIVRWGTTVLIGFLGILGVLSYIVKYPDMIDAEKVVITTSSPPTSVVARSEGNIAKLLVEDKQQVKANEVLAVMQSTANYEAILTVEKQINQIIGNDFNNLIGQKFDRSLQTGEVQGEYSAFIQALETYSFSATNQYDKVNVSQTRNQIERMKEDVRIIGQKKDNALQRKAVYQQNFEKNRKLYDSGIISQRELESSRENSLNIDIEVKNLESQAVSKKIEIGQLDSRITEIQQGSTLNNTDKLLRLKESVNALKASLDKWKQVYILTAPVDGRVSFFNRIWKEQSFVKGGEEMMVIVPDRKAESKIVAKAQLPIARSGKVIENQRVIIFLDGFPYDEYGTVEGFVESKSLIAQEESYLIQIRIDGDSVVTNRKKVIKQSQVLLGRAQIITEEKRFIQRITDKIVGKMNQYD